MTEKTIEERIVALEALNSDAFLLAGTAVALVRSLATAVLWGKVSKEDLIATLEAQMDSMENPLGREAVAAAIKSVRAIPGPNG